MHLGYLHVKRLSSVELLQLGVILIFWFSAANILWFWLLKNQHFIIKQFNFTPTYCSRDSQSSLYTFECFRSLWSSTTSSNGSWWPSISHRWGNSRAARWWNPWWYAGKETLMPIHVMPWLFQCYTFLYKKQRVRDFDFGSVNS